MKALGMIETRGLVASIEAADAMVKAANVTLQCKEHVGGGLVTIMVRGMWRRQGGHRRRCRSGGTGGSLISVHVIPRPHEELEEILDTSRRTDQPVPPRLPPRPLSGARRRVSRWNRRSRRAMAR